VKLVRLEELSHWVQQVMDQLGWQEGDSKRVTWSPNPRLIRYYTTLGLLDRAARFEGRTAYYSSKHLLQILAVKYLQLGGRRLEDIQGILLGLSEEALARLIQLDQPLPEPPQPPSVPQEEPDDRREHDFWSQIPQRSEPAPRPASSARLLTCIEPLPGVQILIDPQQLPQGITLERLVQHIQRGLMP
jgi:DNA-binding transcriptional MerR regulator